jgi:hypothetical protein
MGKLTQVTYYGCTLHIGDTLKYRGKNVVITEFENSQINQRVYYKEGGWDWLHKTVKDIVDGEATLIPAGSITKVDNAFPMLIQNITTGKYSVITSSDGLPLGSAVKIIETSIVII